MHGLFRSRKGTHVALALASSLPLLLAQGCPSPEITSGLTLSVSGPVTNQTVSPGAIVSLTYSVQGGLAPVVRAFYDRDGQANTGDETYFASGLPAGTNQSALWNTGGVAEGAYRVGISASDGIMTLVRYAPGAVTIQQALGITFAFPTENLIINPGSNVTLRFATTASGAFSYTLFYDTDGTPDTGDEVTIVGGSGSGSNVITGIWNTTDLAPGVYYVGVNVRETGATARRGTAYAEGAVSIVAGSFVYLLQPANNIEVSPGTVVEILFSAGVPGGGTGTLRIFYDTDLAYNGNETTIQDSLGTENSSVLWDTLTVTPGSYYIGAALLLSASGTPITAYAPGRVTIEGAPIGGSATTIVVTTPLVDTTIFQGDTYVIRWATGATQANGTVSLFYDLDANNDRSPDGDPRAIVAGLNPAQKSYNWVTAGVAGRFYIIGRLISGGQTISEDTSPARLSVRPPYFWIGNLATSTSFDGAILRGFNFQDHAGSGFAAVSDMDGDETDDFVVLAQYGKPSLENPSGVGRGEAYLIYGNRVRLRGTFDLNRTGSAPAAPPDPFNPTPTLPSMTAGIDEGVIFRGVRPAPTSDLTAGIVSAIAIPDMDGDELPELVFGMPYTDSLSLANQDPDIWRLGILEADGQFQRGGVVIVASTTSIVSNRSAVSRKGDRVVPLQEVGQIFTPMSLSVCDWFLQPTDTDPPANTPIDPPLGPGFIHDEYVECSPCPGCGCAFDPVSNKCFDTVPSEPVQPFGCRILGQAREDGSPPSDLFGESLAVVGNTRGSAYLLVSARDRTAKMSDVPELTEDRVGAGEVYQLRLSNFWTNSDNTIARPYQYIIEDVGYSKPRWEPFVATPGGGSAGFNMQNPMHVVGASTGAHLGHVAAISDFNGDGMTDFVVGAPSESSDAGAAYIVFRRLFSVEGHYLLDKIALAPTDPQRLAGIMIRGEAGDRLGEAMCGGVDLNADGRDDAIFGIPNHRSGQGAVLIVFGHDSLVSPLGGFAIDDLVNNGQGALLVGANAGDQAGFNVADAGDVDGDGKRDLLIAAPTASPRFDSDGDGTPDTIGLDYNGDGAADDLDNNGLPDNLAGAGIVYVVFGSNDLLGEISLSSIGTADLKGFAIVGRTANDNLGGGSDTVGLGARSRGLAGAGDVDGDAKDDILIGSMLADPGGKINAGEAYLIYGGVRP